MKAGKEAGDFGRPARVEREVTKLDALERPASSSAYRSRNVTHEEACDPVMATYAKEIGAEGIFEKINVA